MRFDGRPPQEVEALACDECDLRYAVRGGEVVEVATH
jgi:hypothetical protein